MIHAIKKDNCGYVKIVCDAIVPKRHKEIVGTFDMLMRDGEELTLLGFVDRIISSKNICDSKRVNDMINDIMYEYNGNKNYI